MKISFVTFYVQRPPLANIWRCSPALLDRRDRGNNVNSGAVSRFGEKLSMSQGIQGQGDACSGEDAGGDQWPAGSSPASLRGLS